MHTTQSIGNQRLRIGLTGGIGSGKTTVARFFAELGVTVLDADQVARELIVPGQPALTALAEHFGPSILKDGQLDRAALKHRIFTDPAERIWLDSLLHPLVYRRLEETLNAADAPSTPYFLLVIPLLLETGRRDFVDRLVVVDCPESVQRQRVAQRDGLDADIIERILASQCTRPERLAAADDVIDNSLSPETLRERVGMLHDSIMALPATAKTRAFG